ncbi:MAG TPA: O-antigen ligase family protein, partial [Minicystis sp.]|nr:O-antigen ligase family protein [Minicystis sp.]
AWALLTTAVKRSAALSDEFLPIAVLSGVYLASSLALGSARGLRLFAATFAGCAALVAVVALVQATRPFGCFLGAATDWEGKGELQFDGRPCETVLDCRKDAPVEDGNYRCERVGPLGTSTIGGRIRYRGSLADPNELSLTLAAAIPLAIALFDVERERRRRGAPTPEARKPRVALPVLLTDRFVARAVAAARAVPVGVLITMFGVAVVLSKSRSGLIVYLLVLGIYFVRRIGAWGVVAGCVVGPPMLLFGGRSGAEATESSDERAQLLREAFEFIRNTKGTGLGLGGFPDESSIGLTAHNAYVLAAAECGLVGFLLFGVALYLAIKVPYAIWFGDYAVSRVTGRFAIALAVTMTGAVVGIFFLSWTYKDVLWMLLGASAALYAAARAEDQRVRVRLGAREAFFVPLALLALLAATYVATRIAAPHH